MMEHGGKSGVLPRIMMIDDEVSNLQIVKIILMRESFKSELLFYEDGLTALAYLEKNPVDLILLDLAMPGMDGFEVMSRLKNHPETAEIPVIFLSAYHDTDHILKAFEMGATDFIGKPIISPILTARIRTIVEAGSLQKKLKRSNEELVNTNRLKDELLSICSHDLRSPLASIELVCQILQDVLEGRSGESGAELVTRIVSQSRVARRLVENLLDLNRIEEGRLVPSPSFFPVQEMVRKCLENELPNLEAKEIVHSHALPEEELLCYGDREMISQVLQNVLNNAAKHASSRISLECSGNDFSEKTGGSLRILVKDDGPGVPASFRESIFEKYGKVDHQSGGSGLGLYISRQMVELHNGRIHLQPGEKKKGTVVSIELPNVFKPEQLPELTRYSDSHVLIASSSKIVADLLEGLLLEAGLVNVHRASHPESLESSLSKISPAVLVVDIHSQELTTYLADRRSNSPAPWRWVFFGDTHESETFARALAQSGYHAPAALNPLVFLRELGNLLESREPSPQSATV